MKQGVHNNDFWIEVFYVLGQASLLLFSEKLQLLNLYSDPHPISPNKCIGKQKGNENLTTLSINFSELTV